MDLNFNDEPQRRTLSTNELKNKVQSYQSGIVASPTGIKVSDVEPFAAGRTVRQKDDAGNPIPTAAESLLQPRPDIGIASDYTQEALAHGYGTSRYDTDFYPGMDLENNRALSQPFFSKIGTGLMKAGTTAVSTALNTVLGTVYGLGSALYELAADSNGNGRSFMDTMDAFANNWLSQQFNKIQEWGEETFPNYRTERERSEEYQKGWWKPSHMFTGNFIGDDLLRNMGFSVGAIGGGWVWSKGLGWVMRNGLANDIMKGAVAASNGEAEAQAGFTAAANAIREGNAVSVDADRIAANISKAAKGINKMEAKLQFFGAAIGAMGEGNVEGMMARKEFLDEYENSKNAMFEQEYSRIEDDILNSGDSRFVDEYIVTNPLASPNASPEEKQRRERRLNDDGIAELVRRQQEVIKKYRNLEAYAQQQGDRIASTTFMLNLPILTASNAIQFGRLFSGGWKTNRNIARLSGKISGGLGEGISGTVKPKMSVRTSTVLNTLKNMASEGSEEILQGYASSGAKQVAANNIAAFNELGYDAGATYNMKDWVTGFLDGGNEYLGDLANWKEFALGALTGLLGIPGRRWNGGVFQAARDAREENQLAVNAANKLNNLIGSDEFQNRWKGYIRHMAYERELENDIKNNDEYAWHNDNDAQLMNDVMIFADAGKLNDLEDIVNQYVNLPASSAQQIREVVGEKDIESAWTKGKNDEEVVESVRKRATEIKDAIKQYKDAYNDIVTRAPSDASDDFIKEMVFTATQIRAMENRFMRLFDETMNAIDDTLLEVARSASPDDEKTEEKTKEDYARYKRVYETLFGKNLVYSGALQVEPKAAKDALDDLEKVLSFDNELKQKVVDMRKLSDSRRDFYIKLQTLAAPDGVSKFSTAATTKEKVEAAAESADASIKIKDVTDLESARDRYEAIANDEDKKEFLSNLEKSASDNPARAFLEYKKKYDQLKAHFDDLGPIRITGNENALREWINYMLKHNYLTSRNVDEMIRLNNLPNYEQFLRNNEEMMRGLRSRLATDPNSLSPAEIILTQFDTSPTKKMYNIVTLGMRDHAFKFFNLEQSTAAGNVEVTRTPESVAPATSPQSGIDPAPEGTSANPPVRPAVTEKEILKMDDAQIKAANEQARAILFPDKSKITLDASQIERAKSKINEAFGTIRDVLDKGDKATDREMLSLANAVTDLNSVFTYYEGDEIVEADDLLSRADDLLKKKDFRVYNPNGQPFDGNEDSFESVKYVTKEEIPVGARIIYRVEQPSVFKGNNMLQKAKVVVAQNFTAKKRVEETPAAEETEPTELNSEPITVWASTASSIAGNANDNEPQGQTVKDRQNERKTAYYHMSLNEIDSFQAADARKAIKEGDWVALSKTDLSDFVKKIGDMKWKNPEYKRTWLALKEAGAFDYVRDNLKVGDDVYFIIDDRADAFPTDQNNEKQILLATKKPDGTYQILTTLHSSRQNGKYLYLSELRRDILKEYEERKSPGKIFEFSKHTKVWNKRKGLIVYDFNATRGRRVTDVPGYSKDAPIVFINRDGNIVSLRGDKNAFDKVLIKKRDNDKEEVPPWDPIENKNKNRVGNIYYLADTGIGSYIPVLMRLNRYYGGEVGGVFNTIRESLSKIVDITKAYNSENAEEQKAALHKAVGELVKVLNLKDVMFDLGTYDTKNGAITGLRIIENYQRREEGQSELTEEQKALEKTHIINQNQISLNYLNNILAGKDGRALQVKVGNDNKISNFDQFLEEGRFVTTAESFKAKGVDFYVEPYTSDGNGNFKFDVATTEQAKALNAKEESSGSPAAPSVTVRRGSSGVGASRTTRRAPAETSARVDVNLSSERAADWNSLDVATRELLKATGMTEAAFNSLDPDVKENIIKCKNT